MTYPSVTVTLTFRIVLESLLSIVVVSLDDKFVSL